MYIYIYMYIYGIYIDIAREELYMRQELIVYIHINGQGFCALLLACPPPPPLRGLTPGAPKSIQNHSKNQSQYRHSFWWGFGSVLGASWGAFWDPKRPKISLGGVLSSKTWFFTKTWFLFLSTSLLLPYFPTTSLLLHSLQEVSKGPR